MPGRFRLCVIPGDGVGKEVVPEAVRVLSAAADAGGFALEFHEQPWGPTTTSNTAG